MKGSTVIRVIVVLGLGHLACNSRSTLRQVNDDATTADDGGYPSAGSPGAGGSGGLVATGGREETSAQGGTGGVAGTGGAGQSGSAEGGSSGGHIAAGGNSGLGGGGGFTQDGGVTPDSAVDVNKDAGSNSDSLAPECLSLPGGTCATMVNGCAVCPAGFTVNPTAAGCDSRYPYQWCCTKASVDANDCTDGGGVCVDSEAECPKQWSKGRSSCGANPNLTCCVPDALYCSAFPQRCADVGGICSPASWTPCPRGMEIYAMGADQLGCENNSKGWCCVDAPPSTCSESGTTFCMPGGCSGCFMPVSVSTLKCEAGRSCCADMCD